ncbi:DUF1192 domain-containing protein [Paracraurococcus ruber]|nr:DUF1192 domain-containing protein [Paracraurococcus ruber]TDG28203.1 DUF1192 domain-containing protein [Paracraurococcus ruber]
MEEERPRPATGFAPAVLDSWGVAELRHYIGQLRAEIERAEGAIRRREADRSAADAFFRPPSGS